MRFPMNITRKEYETAVVDYINRGWKVFPVIPDGKAPMAKQGYKKVYGIHAPDANDINSW